MGKTTTLDYESAAGYVSRARESVDAIQQSARRCVAAIEVATEKSSPMLWLTELHQVANMTSRSTAEAGECVDDLMAALKRFDEETREFMNSSAGLDV